MEKPPPGGANNVLRKAPVKQKKWSVRQTKKIHARQEQNFSETGIKHNMWDTEKKTVQYFLFIAIIFQ